ncbi:NAD(P)/FAD-dependent oxidoreductase [Streptomyces hydrogenans]|uniref:NAD(P)/FAD-dependent oxidoreductase n=1 Tax=Streptomyces hydrogenans TaxID=1873719 RepID=UPI001CFC9619|nr:hypothetical protein [Streptomyces hydrogenans]
MTDAVPEGPLLGYGDYPSLIRRPVAGSVPFVGDAALSLDAMSGVGCGFALLSAQLLAHAFAGRALDAEGVRDGLDDYRQRFEKTVLPHAEGICGDSLVDKDEATRQRMFETICGNPELSQKYLALTGRMVLPAEFQRAFMRGLMAAVRVPRGNRRKEFPTPAEGITGHFAGPLRDIPGHHQERNRGRCRVSLSRRSRF